MQVTRPPATAATAAPSEDEIVPAAAATSVQGPFADAGMPAAATATKKRGAPAPQPPHSTRTSGAEAKVIPRRSRRKSSSPRYIPPGTRHMETGASPPWVGPTAALWPPGGPADEGDQGSVALPCIVALKTDTCSGEEDFSSFSHSSSGNPDEEEEGTSPHGRAPLREISPDPMWPGAVATYALPLPDTEQAVLAIPPAPDSTAPPGYAVQSDRQGVRRAQWVQEVAVEHAPTQVRPADRRLAPLPTGDAVVVNLHIVTVVAAGTNVLPAVQTEPRSPAVACQPRTGASAGAATAATVRVRSGVARASSDGARGAPRPLFPTVKIEPSWSALPADCRLDEGSNRIGTVPATARGAADAEPRWPVAPWLSPPALQNKPRSPAGACQPPTGVSAGAATAATVCVRGGVARVGSDGARGALRPLFPTVKIEPPWPAPTSDCRPRERANHNEPVPATAGVAATPVPRWSVPSWCSVPAVYTKPRSPAPTATRDRGESAAAGASAPATGQQRYFDAFVHGEHSASPSRTLPTAIKVEPTLLGSGTIAPLGASMGNDDRRTQAGKDAGFKQTPAAPAERALSAPLPGMLDKPSPRKPVVGLGRQAATRQLPAGREEDEHAPPGATPIPEWAMADGERSSASPRVSALNIRQPDLAPLAVGTRPGAPPGDIVSVSPAVLEPSEGVLQPQRCFCSFCRKSLRGGPSSEGRH